MSPLPRRRVVRLAQDVCDAVLDTMARQRDTGITVDWTAAYGHALGKVGEVAGLTSEDDLGQVEAAAARGLEALLAVQEPAAMLIAAGHRGLIDVALRDPVEFWRVEAHRACEADQNTSAL